MFIPPFLTRCSAPSIVDFLLERLTLRPFRIGVFVLRPALLQEAGACVARLQELGDGARARLWVMLAVTHFLRPRLASAHSPGLRRPDRAEAACVLLVKGHHRPPVVEVGRLAIGLEDRRWLTLDVGGETLAALIWPDHDGEALALGVFIIGCTSHLCHVDPEVGSRGFLASRLAAVVCSNTGPTNHPGGGSDSN